MKRILAGFVYLFGALVGITWLLSGVLGGGFMHAVQSVAVGLAVWWFAVGIGVRLGMTPDEFVAIMKRDVLGFGREVERPLDAEGADEASDHRSL